jgi:hypothetical protein
MSLFAEVQNGIVQQVIVADQEFIASLSNPEEWIQTSYNTRGGIHYAPNSNIPDGGVALRANYAGIGYTYDAINNVFYAPQPYPSWSISSPTWLWEPPIPYPTDENKYYWDENIQNWALFNNEQN